METHEQPEEPQIELSAEAKPVGAELVAYWQREGLIGTRRDIVDSQEHARRIRQIAETRFRPQSQEPS